MRFESVRAEAFGPLVRERLDLAPGLNVIWGPNEAGKSSWHAALYAGLCGMRRSRGKPTSEDQRFTEKHRPWDVDRWEVGATIRLEDGRRVELRHDLAGRVDSRASDAELGRDCSAEIIVDGAPDGSRWLGLDRRSFLATACVRQADLLTVLERSEMLQELVQRVATSGGADATAAAALDRLESFRSEQVGRNISTSIRPLRQAHQAVESAQHLLDVARAEHGRFSELAEEIERSRVQLERSSVELEAAEARQARAALAELLRRHDAARELAERFPAGPPAVDPTMNQLIQDVSEALGGWRALPDEAALSESDTDELRIRLAEIESSLGSTTPPRKAAPGNLSLLIGLGLIGAGLIAFFLGQIAASLIGVVGGFLLAGFWLQRRSAGPIHEPRRGANLEKERDRLLVDIGRSEREAQLRASGRERRQEQLDLLLSLANRCGIRDGDEEARVAELDRWLTHARQQIDALGEQARQFGELSRLQGEATVLELERAIESAEQRLRPMDDTVDLGSAGSDEYTVEQLRDQRDQAAQSLAHFRGQLQEIEQVLPGVADAEEQLAAAQQELARVEQLDAVLAATQRFLAVAQERVHRDIAPVLAGAVRTRLAIITGNRYTDVRVDPASLEVRVMDAEGRWREAALLSHGTAEQVYLLLRVALAEHLTKPGEICPLILDDVTTHCDEQRMLAVLDALHTISRERQVILFSQELGVRAWAEQRLVTERDRLVDLAVTRSGADPARVMH